MSTRLNLTLLEDDGAVFVFIEGCDVGPKLKRWAGHYTDREYAFNHMEGLGLLAASTAKTLREAAPGVPVCMPALLLNPTLTLRAFHVSQVTVGH